MPPSTRRPRHANPYARPRMNDDLHRARTTPHSVSDDDHQELLPASHMDADLNAASGAEQEAEEDNGEEEFQDSNPEDPAQDPVAEDGQEEDEDSVPSTPLSSPTHPQDDSDNDDDPPTPFPPSGLKEISSLASWTVSTAKPGNGVLALRHPSVSQFWQSDGPQPHTLNIHFFKLVSIHRIRIYLDFLSDESYTPTKIQFLAGMGSHDLVDFAEMQLEQPTGWIDVDFSHVGGGGATSTSSTSSSTRRRDDFRASEDWNADDDDDDDEEENDPTHRNYWNKRPVLRAFLVQVRILENHQNGKDTHLRAVQIFARDDEGAKKGMSGGGGKAVMTTTTTTAVGKQKKKNERGTIPKQRVLRKKEANNIKLADWMMNPDIR